MNPLEKKIAERILVEGPITFDAFMDMALYDPEFGYYASSLRRIGREGDFYTSSHLHPVFGHIVCRQIIGMWESLGRPGEFTVIEMGAGEGYLCRDMFDFLRSEDNMAFFDSLRYMIVERNQFQRIRQQEMLSDYMEKVSWISGIREAVGIKGCIFSNELLDAFPVHIVRMGEGLSELYVTHDGHRFIEQEGDLSDEDIAGYFRSFNIALEQGYTTEVNLRIREWLKDADAVLKEGFIFSIDYGFPADEYYSEDRNRGTLMCYHRHNLCENPYENIGAQDMTSHINFSSLKLWADEIGLKTLGYCSQGSFLLSAGIDEEIKKLSETSKDYLFELSKIKKLFLPQGLGESHKVMIQYKGSGLPSLRGFRMRNQMRFL